MNKNQSNKISTKHKTKNKTNTKILKNILKPIRFLLITAKFLATLAALCSIVPYIGLFELGKLFFDSKANGTVVESKTVWLIIKLILLGFVSRFILYSFALAVSHWAEIKLSDINKRKIITALSHAPLSWFSATTSGKIRKAIENDTHDIHYLVAHHSVEQTSVIVTPIISLIYAFSINWKLGILTIITFPVFLTIYGWFVRDMSSKTALLDEKLAEVSSRIVEFISGIKVVKAYGKTGKAHDKYTKAAKEFGDFYWKWCQPLIKGSAITQILITPATLIVVNLGGGALLIKNDWATPPQVLVTTLISLSLPAVIQTLTMSTWMYQLAGSAAVRLHNLFTTKQLPENSTPVNFTNYSVKFNEVSFTYKDNLAIDNVSFELVPNTVTALVGPSSSGKTTLAKLLARFEDPDFGSISIGGINLKDIPTLQLYQTVSFVLQDVQLLNLSILENIRLGKPNTNLTQVRTAAQKAQIDDFIMSLPKQYDTLIGVDMNVSGGQAQRIAIARALIIDTPILILDEATAFADPESESAIQTALSTLVKDKTVLVIAHRVKSISTANQIIILNRGKVQAVGKHDELLRNDFYQHMWQLNTMEMK